MAGIAAAVEGALGDRRAPLPPVASPAGFPRESPEQFRAAMEGRAGVLRGELANPDLMGGEDARPAVTRELAETERVLGNRPAPIAAPQQAASPSPFAGLGDTIEKAFGDASKDPKAVPGSEGALAGERNAEADKPAGVWDAVKQAYSRVQAVPETALAIGSGIVGGVAGAAAGVYKGLTGGKYGTAEGAREAAAHAQEVAHSLTYEPRTDGAKANLDAVGRTIEQTGANKLAGIGPAEGMMLAGAAAAPRATQTFGKAAPAAEAAPAARTGAMGSVGAAAASNEAQVKGLTAQMKTPELRASIDKVANKIDARGVKTVERHLDADTLPVPVKLMEGQASGDVTLASNEFNKKGARPKIGERLQQQNEQLIENTNAIKERAAPDIYVSTKPELGEIAIDGVKSKLNAMKGETTTAYKALEDANGGAFPMDAKTFAEGAYKKLHEKLKAEFVPAGLEKQLEGFLNGKTMNFEQFEAMRTNLANIARSQADGNVKQAAAIVRNALEELPMPAGAEHLKGLADTARAASRNMHAAIEANPAMKAVYRGKASADNFIENVILKADRKTLETIKADLAHDPVAQQAVNAAIIQRLKDAAKIVDDKGVFNQAGYNKLLDSMRPKLKVLLSAEDMADLDRLGRVARYVKGQDAGTFFNNSNTWISALAEAAKSSAAGAMNVAAQGVPIGTWGRKAASFIGENRDTNRILQTGAGVKLKEVGAK